MEATNPTFTLEQLVIWLTVVGSGTATLAVFGRGIKEWIVTRMQKAQNKETISVELQKVKVTERQAQTNEISVIIEGFAQVTAASTARAESAEKSAASAHERVEKVETRLGRVESINNEMINHIQTLEGLIPNPPGPPARPTNWHYV